jgi:hypothetical protein
MLKQFGHGSKTIPIALPLRARVMQFVPGPPDCHRLSRRRFLGHYRASRVACGDDAVRDRRPSNKPAAKGGKAPMNDTTLPRCLLIVTAEVDAEVETEWNNW